MHHSLLRTPTQPAPPPACAAVTAAVAEKHEWDAAWYLSLAVTGLSDHGMAACLAGLDACYHGMDVQQSDQTRTLSRARKLYREALAHAVARRGGSVVIGPVRLSLDGAGLAIAMASGKLTDGRGPFKMEVAR